MNKSVTFEHCCVSEIRFIDNRREDTMGILNIMILHYKYYSRITNVEIKWEEVRQIKHSLKTKAVDLL